MIEQSEIKYLSREKIDIRKWDACIERAENGLIYAYSFYLDTMADNWDALVLNDYEAVMPLTWKKKYGIHYLYQPFLTAQLGLFGKELSEKMVGEFMMAIPLKFQFIEISLNSSNIFSTPSGFTILRSNFELDLAKSYTDLTLSYNENNKRNLRKSQQAGCIFKKGFDSEEVIALALPQIKSFVKESADNVNRFRNLYSLLHKKKMATTYGIFSPQGELISSCVFLFSHNRAYYILVGNRTDSRGIGASHALIDAFIKDYTEKNLILDFEGSDIPNLAQFYSGFGAVRKVYPGIRINRLPFYIRWLKK